jgi:plastocyanin
MTRSVKLRTLLVLALALIAALAGALLLSGGRQANAASGSTVRLSADKNSLKFNTNHLTARQGRVTLVMSNPSALQHAIAVQGKGLNTKGNIVSKGGTSRVSVTLKKGTYTFYCPVDGHRAAGMQGKLVVR